MKGISLLGQRINLGAVSLLQAKKLAQYFNETKDFLGATNAPDMTISHEKEFIKLMNKDKNKYFFGIYLKETGAIIGTISIIDIDTHNKTAETGTMIGLDFVNKGYGTEAKHILLDYIFNTLKLRKIFSKILSYNKRSRSYALACGYKHEATLKDVRLRHGVYWDEWILSITKEEWEPIFTLYKNKHYI